eukprot:1196258-Prorocentrum_minimum.AAC.7
MEDRRNGVETLEVGRPTWNHSLSLVTQRRSWKTRIISWIHSVNMCLGEGIVSGSPRITPCDHAHSSASTTHTDADLLRASLVNTRSPRARHVRTANSRATLATRLVRVRGAPGTLWRGRAD